MNPITRAPLVSLLSGLVLVMAMTVTTSAEPVSDPVLTISGELTYRARIALPPDSLAILELIDPSVPGGRVISERRLPLEGRQVPIPIDLSVDRAELVPHRIHEARGAILSQGLILWVMEPVAIDAASGSVELGPILMRQHEPIDLTNALVCGEQPIRVGFRDGEMRLQVGDQAFDLRQAVSASGARYVALADPQTWVWIKGDRATLQLAGQSYPECTPVATGPSALRATGNEPPWSMEIDQTHVLLVIDLGETRIRVALTDPEPVEGGIRYDNLIEDGELTITLLDRVCLDSMSGMPHPKTVKISLDGVALEGCGGDPAGR